MCQYVETIGYRDGKFCHLNLHEARFQRTREALGWQKLSLKETLSQHSFPSLGYYKIRVVYTEEIQFVEYSPYQTPQLLRIGIVETDEVDYRFKSTNRDYFRSLYSNFPGYDDFIIIKDGFVTDSTFCNVAFLKDGNWCTPAHPLLEGVQRAALLEQGILKKRDIRLSDLCEYSHISFFNAMNEHQTHILPMESCEYLGKFNPVL
ncbi:MAG: aminotransferase class IV [Bacteroidales bacterium]